MDGLIFIWYHSFTAVSLLNIQRYIYWKPWRHLVICQICILNFKKNVRVSTRAKKRKSAPRAKTHYKEWNEMYAPPPSTSRSIEISIAGNPINSGLGGNPSAIMRPGEYKYRVASFVMDNASTMTRKQLIETDNENEECILTNDYTAHILAILSKKRPLKSSI